MLEPVPYLPIDVHCFSSHRIAINCHDNKVIKVAIPVIGIERRSATARDDVRDTVNGPSRIQMLVSGEYCVCTVFYERRFEPVSFWQIFVHAIAGMFSLPMLGVHSVMQKDKFVPLLRRDEHSFKPFEPFACDPLLLTFKNRVQNNKKAVSGDKGVVQLVAREINLFLVYFLAHR